VPTKPKNSAGFQFTSTDALRLRDGAQEDLAYFADADNPALLLADVERALGEYVSQRESLSKGPAPGSRLANITAVLDALADLKAAIMDLDQSTWLRFEDSDEFPDLPEDADTDLPCVPIAITQMMAAANNLASEIQKEKRRGARPKLFRDEAIVALARAFNRHSSHRRTASVESAMRFEFICYALHETGTDEKSPKRERVEQLIRESGQIR
jgi:hypothetical protein